MTWRDLALTDSDRPEADLNDLGWSEPAISLAALDLGAGVIGLEAPRTTADGIPLSRILADRPDVLVAFYTEYYGPNNDHHSSAWVDRVGGATPEDYANYWYETHGRYEGYRPSGGDGDLQGAPAGPSYSGRTTADGISLTQILIDRPDVYRAFFTEFNGPNNDHKSDAWVKRVGGTTLEDYANYWYERYGRWEGYHPSTAASPVPSGGDEPPAPEPTPPAEPPTDSAATPLPPADPASAASPYPTALVIHFLADGQIELTPATADEIVENGVVVGLHSLMDPVTF